MKMTTPALLASLLALGAAPLAASENASATNPFGPFDITPSQTRPAPAPATERDPSWGLTLGLGFGGAGGDFGELLQSPVAGDFNIFRNHGKWRFGIGLSFTSFT